MEEYEQEASKRLKEDPLVVTLELGCNQAQQLCVRRLVGTKRPTGMAQIAQLDTYTQPVVISAMLPDKGKIFSR